jgi:hypothetical protein
VHFLAYACHSVRDRRWVVCRDRDRRVEIVTIWVPNFGTVIFLLTAGDLVCLRVLGEDIKEGVIIVCRSPSPLTDYLFILPKAKPHVSAQVGLLSIVFAWVGFSSTTLVSWLVSPDSGQVGSHQLASRSSPHGITKREERKFHQWKHSRIITAASTTFKCSGSWNEQSLSVLLVSGNSGGNAHHPAVVCVSAKELYVQ